MEKDETTQESTVVANTKETVTRLMKYHRLPKRYRYIHLVSSFTTVVLSLIFTVSILKILRIVFHAPPTVYWASLPLFVGALIISMMAVNIVLFMIEPIREYLDQVCEEYDLPKFSESMSQLTLVYVLALPSFLLVVVVVAMSFLGFKKLEIGIASIFEVILVVFASLYLYLTRPRAE